jgi:hypothetical protein
MNRTTSLHRPPLFRLLASALLLACTACGGGGGGGGDDGGPLPPPPPPPPPQGSDTQYLVSATSPFAAGCDREDIGGTLYTNAEVEPWLAVNPLDDHRMVGVWQQDRWSNGSSRGVLSATSTDGGETWTRQPVPFSRCAGGSNRGGDYARVSNPWVSYAPDGTVHAVALASSGVLFQSGSSNAILASRSLDDGRTWSDPIALIRDGSGFFNDKDAITADPLNANLVYAVWDRLVAGDNGGPTYFARSADGGESWETARPIYDPGQDSQTISNAIVVLPTGTLVNMFVQIDYDGSGDDYTARIAVLRSFDKGVSWGNPITVADLLSVGTVDPQNDNPVRDAAIIPQVAVAKNGDLFVVWQDSRFSNGERDAIAISRSIDDGATWSAPTRVNDDPDVAAFNPAVHVRSDGVVGVTYYDFRSDTSAATLMTDYWLARSADFGATWTESRISEPFDLAVAPQTNAPGAGGYFLGDYQGLSSRGNVFLPFYAKANNGSTSNRTDIFSAPAVSATSSASRAMRAPVARSSTGIARTDTRNASTQFRVAPELADRIGANLQRARRERLPDAGRTLQEQPRNDPWRREDP